MPVIKKIETEEALIHIWRIEENLTELSGLIDSRLSKGSDKIVSEKAKLQWAASRACLSQLLSNNNISYNGIQKDEYGKPHLINSECNISVSHTDGYVAAIASKNNFVGVDIETKFNQAYKLRSKFMNQKELDYAGDDKLKSTLIWSAKESIYKGYGRKRLIFKDDMQLLNIGEGSMNFNFSKLDKEIKITLMSTEQFVLTYSV